MAFKKSKRAASKRSAAAGAERDGKQVLTVTVSLQDWDLEEVYSNDANTFWVGTLKRKGWASYKVLAFGDMAEALAQGVTGEEKLKLGIVHKRNQDGEWETVLRVEDAGIDLPSDLPF
jgi:hypothetical protein